MKRDAKGRFVSEEKVYAKGYKGFDPGLVCISKIYKENTIFKESLAKMCEKGMHFCKKAKDVLFYYPFLNSFCMLNEFAAVKALAKVATRCDKSVTTKLKVLNKLSTTAFITHIVAYFSTRLKTLNKESNPAVQVSKKSSSTLCTSCVSARLAGTGDNMELLAGEDGSSLVSAGNNCSLYVRNFSRLASTGSCTCMISSGVTSSLSTSGNYCQLISTGDDSDLAAAGRQCNLTATGKRSRLVNSGNMAALTALGEASVLVDAGSYSHLYAEGARSRLLSAGAFSKVYAAGKKGIAITIGPSGMVKGKLGCFLGCMEWHTANNDEGFNPLSFASGWVDGEKIKPDTWYIARDGQLVEVEE